MQGPNPPDIFVNGTDTGIGKSVVSLLLMQYLVSAGCQPFYLKPIQTGCPHPGDPESDAGFVYSHIPGYENQDPAKSTVYCYSQPKAPWFAARNEGEQIDAGHIGKCINELRQSYAPLVLEGAGGLFVPATQDLLMIDLAKRYCPDVLLVARAGLGTINHTLLSISALRQRGIRILGVIMVDDPESGTDPDMVRENIEAVQRFGEVAVSGVVGKIDDFDHPPQEYLEIVGNLFNS
ncbi:MAG: dethiobiotin synthase [Thermodesulfobacteriota bacterium]